MPDHRTYELRLRIGTRAVTVSAEVPEAAITLVDLLPIARGLTGLVTEVAADDAARAGRPVRCGPGCGACCRQLVPIAPAEAVALRRLIATMDPDRRAAVLARFESARARLAGLGLLERLREPPADADARRGLGLAYFAAGIPCPFLEQASCGIHPERPVACREYLVASDPAHCADPAAGQAAVLELPRRPSAALFRLSAQLAAEPTVGVPSPPPVGWLPLVLALDDAAVDVAEVAAACRPGPELFERLLALWLALGTGDDTEPARVGAAAAD